MYLTEHIAAKQANPGDDVVSILVGAEVDGRSLDRDELLIFLLSLLVAGNETTRTLDLRRDARAVRARRPTRRPGLRSESHPGRGRGVPALGDADPGVRPHGDRRHRHRRRRGQGARLPRDALRVGQPRRARVRTDARTSSTSGATRTRRTSRSASASTCASARRWRAWRHASCSRSCWPGTRTTSSPANARMGGVESRARHARDAARVGRLSGHGAGNVRRAGAESRRTTTPTACSTRIDGGRGARSSPKRACAPSCSSSCRRPGPFHVGVLLENVPEFVFLLMGAGLAGAAVVGINPTRRGAELARDINHTDCQLIVTDESMRAVARRDPARRPRRAHPRHRRPGVGRTCATAAEAVARGESTRPPRRIPRRCSRCCSRRVRPARRRRCG